jgi:hypothetical protein
MGAVRPFSVLVIVLLCSGCGPEPYIARIQAAGDKPAGYDLYKLGEYPRHEEARATLLKALTYDDPDVRCVAVISLRRHLPEMEYMEKLSALEEMIPLLDDTRFGQLSRPVFSRLIPAGVHDQLRSVRVEALYTMADWTQQDHGFDKHEWRQALQDLKQRAGG